MIEECHILPPGTKVIVLLMHEWEEGTVLDSYHGTLTTQDNMWAIVGCADYYLRIKGRENGWYPAPLVCPILEWR